MVRVVTVEFPYPRGLHSSWYRTKTGGMIIERIHDRAGGIAQWKRACVTLARELEFNSQHLTLLVKVVMAPVLGQRLAVAHMLWFQIHDFMDSFKLDLIINFQIFSPANNLVFLSHES